MNGESLFVSDYINRENFRISREMTGARCLRGVKLYRILNFLEGEFHRYFLKNAFSANESLSSL